MAQRTRRPPGARLSVRCGACDLVPGPDRVRPGPSWRSAARSTRTRSRRSNRMGDAEQAAAAHNLLAALFHYLGDETAAVGTSSTAALDGLDVTRSPQASARPADQRGVDRQSRQPGDGARRSRMTSFATRTEWGREGAIAEAHGPARRHSGQPESLGRRRRQRTLNEARQQLAASSRIRRAQSRVEVIVLSAESDLLRATQPGAAVEAARRAIGLRRAARAIGCASRNSSCGSPRPTSSGAGPQRPELALDRGIAAFEEERQSMSEKRRISSLDESWETVRNLRATGDQAKGLRSRLRAGRSGPRPNPGGGTRDSGRRAI